jgi:Uma2 family endonuclease
MATVATQLITAEDLLAMGDIGRCELIYGELLMMSPAGAEHGLVAMRFGSYLQAFVDEQGRGVVFAAETGFIIERNPDLVRAPDASFVGASRLPVSLPRGYFEGVPDLAVEVVSPDDTKREVAEKVNMWLAHGTEVVWVAYPQQMTVEIHRVGKPPQRLTAADEIRNEPLLPGFVLPLSKVFKLP